MEFVSVVLPQIEENLISEKEKIRKTLFGIFNAIISSEHVAITVTSIF